ncbi:hypothetical protein [Oryzomonas rubra]|uniref:Lipoprotein n=1 Tax=Oryzomonas rubra TaxID=2509454 RepID=A0A5A9XNU8_9BACT|nr:hypothetical protein [Oryzomonas rubra]KAA0894225.1 hypothetical protein ET418_04525 [Oryzomonas rubra]
MKFAINMACTVLLLLALGGCATAPAEYNKVFDAEHSLKQNQAEFSQPADIMLKLVTQTLILQGFTVENTDAKAGIIKASRVIPDKNNNEITYQIQLTSNLTELPGRSTNVTLAAHQQSILRHESTIWWHLLWIFPVIPIGHEYQTAVLNEGSISDPGFYADFFATLKTVEAKYAAAAKAAAEKAEAERIAAEKAAAAKAEADRIAAVKAAAEKAEADRIAVAKAAAEKVEADRIAAEKAATEKAATEKAEADRIAAEKVAAAKAEADLIATEKAQANADRAAQSKKKKTKKKIKAKTNDSAAS